MAEYINKEKMLKYLDETHTDNEWLVGQYNADWIYSFIESQPTADVEEVKHGEWVDNGIQDSMLSECSLCGFPCGAYTFNYCPNCGAKMDGGKI